jgi:hypothetical protein
MLGCWSQQLELEQGLDLGLEMDQKPEPEPELELGPAQERVKDLPRRGPELARRRHRQKGSTCRPELNQPGS